jgi:hypothetical protein
MVKNKIYKQGQYSHATSGLPCQNSKGNQEYFITASSFNISINILETEKCTSKTVTTEISIDDYNVI